MKKPVLNTLVKILPVFILAVFLTSCLSTKKFKTYVKNSLPYNSRDIISKQPSMTDYTVLISDSLNLTDSVVEVRRTKGYFVPAIFVYTWNNTLEAKINKNLYFKYFTNYFEERALEYQLKKYLSGRKLILEVESLPSCFSYTTHSTAVYTIFAYSYIYGEYISPKSQIFRVKFKIMQDDFEMANVVYEKSFDVTVGNSNSTTQKFISNYIENTKIAFKNACNELFDKVVESL